MKKSKAGKIPGSLVVVFVAVIFDQWMSEIYGIFRLEPEHMVQMPLTDLKNNIQSLILFPLPEGFMHSHIWMNGIIIGVIASLETLLSIEAADKIDPGKRVTPLNRELLAQGFGNMVSGLIGGLPITSVVVRTSANVNSGATSRNSSVFHGVLLLISILFFPELLNMIPKSALAVILIFTGYKLAKPEVFKHAFKKGSSTYIPFLVTILAILFSDMLIGIGIGMFVGMIYILKNNVIRSVIHIESENNHLIKFIKDVTFFNKSGIKKILSNIKPHSNVLIDMGENIFVDNDILELIHEFKIHSKTYQIELEIKNNDHRL